MTDYLASLSARCAYLEDQLEQSKDERYRDLERDHAVTVEALRRVERRLEQTTATALKLASESSVTLSKLRPHMKLMTQGQWDALETLHNQLARFTLPDASPRMAPLVEAQEAGTVDEWRSGPQSPAANPLETVEYVPTFDAERAEKLEAYLGAVIDRYAQSEPRVIPLGSWHYLSFCDPGRPKGTQFLGACIVGPVPDLAAACKLAWARGCNPGGEVQGLAIEADKERKIPESFRNRLLTKDEVLVDLEAHLNAPEAGR